MSNRYTSHYQDCGGGDGGQKRGRDQGNRRSERGGYNNQRQDRGNNELKLCTQHHKEHLWRECPDC